MDAESKSTIFIRNLVTGLFFFAIVLLIQSYASPSTSIDYTDTQQSLAYSLPLIISLLLLSIPNVTKFIAIPVIFIAAAVSTFFALTCTDGSCVVNAPLTVIILSLFLFLKLIVNKIAVSHKSVVSILGIVGLIILVFSSITLYQKNNKEMAFKFNMNINNQVSLAVRENPVQVNEIINLCNSFKTPSTWSSDIQSTKARCEDVVRDIQKNGKLTDPELRHDYGIWYEGER